MWPFKKKETPSPTLPIPIKKECDHKYKDFSWYIDAKYDYNSQRLTVKVVEPYVCIHCGHRKDVVLNEVSRYFSEFEQANQFYFEFQEKYKDKIKDKAFLEDEIHDMMLIDKQYLDIYAQLHSNKKSVALRYDLR